MICFDFTRSAPPTFVRKLLEFRVPVRYHAGLITLSMTILGLAGAWSIESYRLHDTLAVQFVYQQRYNLSQRALRQAHVYEERVKRIVALDRRIRTIRRSGYAEASRLAEIANNLPSHAWLTTIAYDGDAISIEGQAKDLRALSDVVRGLTHAKHFREPSLVNAAVSTDPRENGLVKYIVRVESATR
jgi:hypothetical protein